ESFDSDTSKYVFGPVWDLDWCFGYERSHNYFQNESTANYWKDMTSMEVTAFVRDIRFKYEPLGVLYRQLWEKFMQNDLQELLEYCQDYYDFAHNSFDQNKQKWGDGTNYAQQAKTAASWLSTRTQKIYDDIVAGVRPYIPDPVEPVEFANNKLYTITCQRGDLILSQDHNGLEAGQSAWWSVTDEEKQFAIINIEGTSYLYSPYLKKFLQTGTASNGLWVDELGSPIIIDMTHPNGEYQYMISTISEYGSTLWFNNNTSTMVINGYSNPDAGNRWKITEVGSFDPTEALELAAGSMFAVTNRFIWEGKVIGTETHQMPKGSEPPTPSDEWKNAFISLIEPADMPYEITEDVTLDYEVQWYGPFNFSEAFDDAYWYNMTIRSDYFVGRQEEEPYYPSEVDEETLLYDGDYFWAFGGDPYHVKVYNYTTGFGKTLTAVGDYALMRTGDYAWDLLPNRDGFVLRKPETEYSCLNQFGGVGGPLKFWNDKRSLTDNGSTFRIFEANPSGISSPLAISGGTGNESYNLAGQRVSGRYKGIVIKNGRKVLVK
ncbi:MAG: hypothetical protein J5733_02290, partial [Bacteroidaceae bacterium]|nr:hypothetical protein [Bacteroidaceae bacterium]